MPLDPRLTQRIESTPEEIAAAWVGTGPRSLAPVEVRDWDPAWPGRFDELAGRIRAAVGPVALHVEHIGSTSVPGLAAKPIIDLDLTVPDSTDEASYVAALEADGWELVVREPDWWEHRMLRLVEPRANLHVFSPDCPEAQRHVIFRDWLREHDDDRDLYARVKQGLAAEGFTDVVAYTSRKDEVIDVIYAKAFADLEARLSE